MKPPSTELPPPRPQKKSQRVSLGLVVFVAGSLAACGPTDYRRCVDRDGRVVDDEQCASQARPGGIGYYGPYRWYYGGRGLRMGETVSGGSFTPQAGTSYHSSTVRGGFGHSAAAHGSGGHA